MRRADTYKVIFRKKRQHLVDYSSTAFYVLLIMPWKKEVTYYSNEWLGSKNAIHEKGIENYATWTRCRGISVSKAVCSFRPNGIEYISSQMDLITKNLFLRLNIVHDLDLRKQIKTVCAALRRGYCRKDAEWLQKLKAINCWNIKNADICARQRPPANTLIALRPISATMQFWDRWTKTGTRNKWQRKRYIVTKTIEKLNACQYPSKKFVAENGGWSLHLIRNKLTKTGWTIWLMKHWLPKLFYNDGNNVCPIWSKPVFMLPHSRNLKSMRSDMRDAMSFRLRDKESARHCVQYN